MDFGTILSTYGLAGLVMFVLGSVVLVLYKDNKRLEAEKIALVEARRSDAVEVTKQVMQVVQDNSQNIAILTAKIDTGKEASRRGK